MGKAVRYRCPWCKHPLSLRNNLHEAVCKAQHEAKGERTPHATALGRWEYTRFPVEAS